MILYTLSQNTFDEMMDKIDIISEDYNLKANDYAPSLEELAEIKDELEKYYPFLCWIDETGYDTEENAEARQIIRMLITKFVDVTE